MIYLDHSATTPLRASILQTIVKTSENFFGNASAIYSIGRRSSVLIRGYRQKVAELLGFSEEEIIFTSGATESNNSVILGSIIQNMNRIGGAHIITSPIEHQSVLEPIKNYSAKFGIEHTILPVDKYGQVDPEDLDRSIKQNTILVSICALSPDVGTIQPINEIAKVCTNKEVPFHCDFSQALRDEQLIALSPLCAYSTFSMHKAYGPKGAGILTKKKSIAPIPIFFGGEQENGLRPGTENIPTIAAIAKTLEEIKADTEEKKVQKLRDRLDDNLRNGDKTIKLVGHPQKRGKFHLCYVVSGVNSEKLLIALDMAGVCASSGSACAVGKQKTPMSLQAMGYSNQDINCALRLTLGRSNNIEEVDKAAEIILSSIRNLR